MSRESDFWSRRKAKVLEEEQAEARTLEAREQASREAALEARPDEEILQELGLPDPDTLNGGDDFSAFMDKAVPERLRRRALRRLWRSNSALANLDGLVDYGEDYTDSATVVENLKTAYQVGKGMFARIEEMTRSAQAQGAGAAEDAGATPAEEPEPQAALPEEAGEDTAVETGPATDPEDAPAVAALPRRRMHFIFDERSGGDA